MSQKEVWKKYITAKSKILEHKSKPIGIDTSNDIQLDGLKLHLSIDQCSKQVSEKEVEQIFNVKDFDFNSGYIQTSIENSTNITNEKLTKLKELAEICYIEFNENPVVEGFISAKDNSIKDELKKVIKEIPTNYQFNNSGVLFLTIDEWKKSNEIRGLRFDKKIGAVFSIKPSLSFLISSFYKNIEISQRDSKTNNNFKVITIIGELHQNIYELFEKHFSLKKRGNCLTFTFQNAENLKRKVEELKRVGITLSEPQENCLHFVYDNSFYEKHESDLSFEVFRLKRSLEKYFPK